MAEIISKKVLIFCIIIFFVNLSFMPYVACGDISILDAGNSLGDTLYVGGDGPGCYDNIQSAINDAKSGDTVFVYDDSSPYYENIVISKSLNLKGENRETTIIDGGNAGNVIHISANFVNISSFSIQNSGHDSGISINSDYNMIDDISCSNCEYGIRFESSHINIVSGNKIEDNNHGIYLSDTYSVDIHENSIIDNLIGIRLCHKSKENTIYGNNIVNSDRGVDLDDSSYNNIYWNIITDNQYGIYYYYSLYNNIYSKNIIQDNQYGIYFYQSSYNNIYDGNIVAKNNKCGIYLYGSSNNDIHESNIENNGYGIKLNDSSINDVYWNNIRYNGYGIYLQHSSNNNVYLNNIDENYQIGIYIYFSSNSKVVYNNFIANYVSAYFKKSLFSFNSWKKNYWDDWNGTGFKKINGEIEGFISLENWFNFDFRPVKQPYEI